MPQPLRLAEPTAITEYRRYFPDDTLSCFQLDLVETRATDLKLWGKVLYFWASNGYKGRSIGRMLDYYDEQKIAKQPKRDAGWCCQTCGIFSCGGC